MPDILWTHSFEPRPAQTEILNWVSDNQDADILAVEAPTGVGKSPLCTAIANDGGGIILTPQITLQEQYMKDFPWLSLVKGAANYTCHKTGKDCKASAVVCQNLCSRTGCPYKEAKTRFLERAHGTTNYAYLFAILPHLAENSLDNKKWLIFDEGHHLESQLIESSAIHITQEFCNSITASFVTPEDGEAAFEELTTLWKHARSVKAGILAKMESDEKVSDAESVMAGKIEEFETKYLLYREQREEHEYVFYVGDSVKPSWGVKPLFAHGAWETLIGSRNKKVFITSATILDPLYFAECLGVDDIRFHAVDSPFSADNRKVFIRPVATLNFGNMQQEFPKVVRKIDEIVGKFGEYKGIIHCLDEKSRVLTVQGFKGIDELEVGDMVATRSPSGQLEYQPAKEVSKANYNGDMVQVDKRGLSMLVTPEHLAYVLPGKDNGSSSKLQPRLIEAHHLVSGLKNRTGNRVTTFRVPITAEWSGRVGVDRAYARLLGWFAAEGNLRHVKERPKTTGPRKGRYASYGVVISQKDIAKTEVPALLRAFGSPFIRKLKTCDTATVMSRPLYDLLNADCYVSGTERGCFRKKVPDCIKSASPEVIKEFLLALCEGDGTTRKGQLGRRTEEPSKQIYTTSKHLRDGVVELALKCGWNATFRDVDTSKWKRKPLKCGRVIPGGKISVIYLGSGIRNQRIEAGEATMVPYHGRIFCPTTDNGVIFVEREGRTYWTGNSHSFKLTDQIEALIAKEHRWRLIVHKPDSDREELLKRFHGSNHPMILVSPSMTEGVDLKEDLGRFAIFPKVPYPSLGDKWVKARNGADERWYPTQVAKTLIQGAGRVCRSQDDWGYTFILDGAFDQFYNRNANYFPDWFTDALR